MVFRESHQFRKVRASGSQVFDVCCEIPFASRVDGRRIRATIKVTMVWTTYKERIKRLSLRLVEAQKPIRVLDAIKWEPWVEEKLLKSGFKEIPVLDKAYYEKLDRKSTRLNSSH